MSRAKRILDLVNSGYDGVHSDKLANVNSHSSCTGKNYLREKQFSELSEKSSIQIKAHFEENEEVPDSIILTSSPLPKKKMKNWFCNRGFSPPETNSKDVQVETELMKNSSSNQKCNSFKVQDRDEDITKKIVIHEIITIEPSSVISVSPTVYLGFQSNELNDTNNTTYEWKKKSDSVKTMKEIEMSSSEKFEDVPNDSDSDHSLYYASDNKEITSDYSGSGPIMSKSFFSHKNKMRNEEQIQLHEESSNRTVLTSGNILLREGGHSGNTDSHDNQSVEVLCSRNFENNQNHIKESSDTLITENISNMKQPYKRKPDYCYYCETNVLNFGRHILKNHHQETAVKEIISKEVKSKERRQLFDNLRRKGNFLGGDGKCFKAVRQTYVPERTLLPCDNCLGYFSSKLLYRHRKKCLKDKESKLSAQSAGHSLMLSNLKIDYRLKEEVFPRMRADKISMEAKSDPLIRTFGTRYLKSHREKHFVNVTSRKMRELSKILLEMRKLDASINTLFSALQPKYFDLFVEATKRVAKYDPAKDVYISPTFAMNIGTSLKQCCDLAISMAYKKQAPYVSVASATVEADLKTLIHLFETNWSFEVSSHAASNLNLNKWNKVTIIPLASDLKLLRQYLLKIANEASEYINKMQPEITKTATSTKLDKSQPRIKLIISYFNTLMESVYCRVILFNRKRSGELQRMYLHTYLNSPSNENYEEFSKVVSPTERILLNTLKRVVIRGKRGRGVPVLFTADVQKHIQVLIDLRDHFVPKNNPYLFTTANSSSNIIGYKILSKHAKLSGAKNFASITSTRLRKHLATLSQLFTLSDGEIEQLATFMGHTSGIHRNSYRLPDDIYQTAKISKLLMVMEEGGANKYQGKSLDEITIDFEENLLENKSDMSDVSESEEEAIIPNLEQEIYSTSNRSTCVSEMKKTKGRILVPWTIEQKTVTQKFFKNHIETKRAPKRIECEKLKSEYSELMKNKDWLKIKVFIQNTYSKKN